ncbi:MAG: tetratricopeptide repeat protein [Planctomycetota bacterium]
MSKPSAAGWTARTTLFFAAMAALLCLGSGCFRRTPPVNTQIPPPRPPVTEEVFAAGQEAYAGGDYSTAARRMGDYAAANQSTPRGLEARYWQAMSLLAMGQPIRARELFKGLYEEIEAGLTLRAMALRGEGRTYLAQNDYVRAEKTYQELLDRYPNESDTQETLKILAECARRRGDSGAAATYERKMAGTRAQELRLVPEGGGAGGETYAPDRSPAEGGARYVVQAGLFKDRAMALALVRRLQASGFEAILVERPGEAIPYAVQAGSFLSRSRAVAHATALQQHGFQAFVKP